MIHRLSLIALLLCAGCRTQQAALEGNAREPAIVITAAGRLLVNNQPETVENLGKRVKKAAIPPDTSVYILIQGEPTDPITQIRMKAVSSQMVLVARHNKFFFVTEREASSEVLDPGERAHTGATTLPPAGNQAAAPALTPPREAPGSAANPRMAAPTRSRYMR